MGGCVDGEVADVGEGDGGDGGSGEGRIGREGRLESRIQKNLQCNSPEGAGLCLDHPLHGDHNANNNGTCQGHGSVLKMGGEM